MKMFSSFIAAMLCCTLAAGAAPSSNGNAFSFSGSHSTDAPPTPVPIFETTNCSMVSHKSQHNSLRDLALEKPTQYLVTNTSGDYVVLTPCTPEPLTNCSKGNAENAPTGYAAFLPENGTKGCTEIYTQVGAPTLYSELEQEFTTLFYTADLSHGLRISARCNEKLELGQQEAQWLLSESMTNNDADIFMKHLRIEAKELCPRIKMPPVPSTGPNCDADWYDRDEKIKSSLQDFLALGASEVGWLAPKSLVPQAEHRQIFMEPCGQHSVADKKSFVDTPGLPGCPALLGYMAYWNETNQSCVVLDGREDTYWDPNHLYYKTVYKTVVNFTYDMNVSNPNSGTAAPPVASSESGSSVTPVPPTPIPTEEREFWVLDPIVVTVLVRCGEGQSREATVEKDELNEKTGIWERTLSFTDIAVCGKAYPATPAPTEAPERMPTGAIAGIMIGVVAFVIFVSVCIKWRMMKKPGEYGEYDPVN